MLSSMGGTAVAVVDCDADLSRAVPSIIKGGLFIMQGRFAFLLKMFLFMRIYMHP